jgi:hypothetical protein
LAPTSGESFSTTFGKHRPSSCLQKKLQQQGLLLYSRWTRTRKPFLFGRPEARRGRPLVQRLRRTTWTKTSGLVNEDDWYEDFHHGNFAFDDASPLSAELHATPWPPSYKPPQLPMYDGHSDPKQFLMSYEATISSYGGNTAVMAKSFVMAVKNVAQTWCGGTARIIPT